MDSASVALARSLIVDIAQMHDMYTFIHENARDILKENPQDALHHSPALDSFSAVRLDVNRWL